MPLTLVGGALGLAASAGVLGGVLLRAGVGSQEAMGYVMLFKRAGGTRLEYVTDFESGVLIDRRHTQRIKCCSAHHSCFRKSFDTLKML